MEIELVKLLKKMLREKQWDEAMKCLFEFITPTVDYFKKFSVDDEKLIEDFNEIMAVIEQAIACQDVILLCDMIEYELVSYVHQVKTEKGDL